MTEEQITERADERDEEYEKDEERSGVVGPAPEKAAKALEVAQALAERMQMAANISVRDEHERIVVVLDEKEGSTDVAQVLGSRRPPAVPAFQFLLNKIVNRFPEGRKHIVVEAASIPRRNSERRPRNGAVNGAAPNMDDLDPTLVELGKMLGARAKELNRVITVHPMLPGDRRAIHLTVMGMEDVHTVSEGDGIYRRMHIVPDAVQPRDPRGDRNSGGANNNRRRRKRRRGGPGDRPQGGRGFYSDDRERY